MTPGNFQAAPVFLDDTHLRIRHETERTLPVRSSTFSLSPRKSRLAVLGALLVLAIGASAKPAHAFEMAIQDDPIFVMKQYFNTAPNDRSKAYTLARQMHAKSIRMNIIWSQFVARGSSYAVWDEAVNKARAAGFKPQLTILGTPFYDQTGDQLISYLNPKPAIFAAWCRQIAQHFKGRVTRYSLWNEPNLRRFLSPPGRAAKIYHDIYKAGYTAIKGVSSRNEVLFGELTSPRNADPLKFTQKVVRFGALRTDGFSLHPFQFFNLKPNVVSKSYPGGIGNTPNIKKLLATLARQKKFRTPKGGVPGLFYTEFAYLVRGYTTIKPESKRAAYATAAVNFAKAQGVRQLVWYQLAHPPDAFLRDQIWDSGLVTLSGGKSLTFNAIARAAR